MTRAFLMVLALALAPAGVEAAELRGAEDVPVLVRYKNEAGSTFASSKAVREGDAVPRLSLKAETVKRRDLEELRENADIDIVEADANIRAMMVGPVRRLTDSQVAQFSFEHTPWGLNFVHAFEVPLPSDPIRVCVVDTGYGLGHEDLPPVAPEDGTSTAAGNWSEDINGHGTHCAGTIGAIGGNGRGVTSLIPDPDKVTMMVGKGLDDYGDGQWSTVLAAVEGCAEGGARVISMSLGGPNSSEIVRDAFRSLYDDGILLVAASGNGGSDADMSYPAAYPFVMSVGAVDSNGDRADYPHGSPPWGSQNDEQVEIAAPGVDVVSTVAFGDSFFYAYGSGTSMACPHVAGVAAKVWAHFPECTNNQIRNVLTQTAAVRGGGCNEDYGHGIVDARAAYDRLVAEGCAAGGESTHPLSALAVGGCGQGRTPSPPSVAPDGYALVPGGGNRGSGYCDGHDCGMGVFNITSGDVLQGCAGLCDSTASCASFNVAPGVHERCHLFRCAVGGVHDEYQWGWECYTRS